VLDENRHRTIADLVFVDLFLDLIGDFVSALAFGSHFN
jgi:hypothetical protein